MPASVQKFATIAVVALIVSVGVVFAANNVPAVKQAIG